MVHRRATDWCVVVGASVDFPFEKATIRIPSFVPSTPCSPLLRLLSPSYGRSPHSGTRIYRSTIAAAHHACMEDVVYKMMQQPPPVDLTSVMTSLVTTGAFSPSWTVGAHTGHGGVSVAFRRLRFRIELACSGKQQ